MHEYVLGVKCEDDNGTYGDDYLLPPYADAAEIECFERESDEYDDFPDADQLQAIEREEIVGYDNEARERISLEDAHEGQFLFNSGGPRRARYTDAAGL